MRLKHSMLIQWSDEDQLYICSLPEFGEFCKTHGDTFEKAARNGREVLEMLIESLQNAGKPLPNPDLYPGETANRQPSRNAKLSAKTSSKSSKLRSAR